MREVRDGLRRARTELEVARFLLSGNYGAQAASRAYYAALYAAEAALLLLGETRSKHSGVIAAFGQLIVVQQAGIDRSVGRLLHDLFDLRLDADYESGILAEDRAKAAVEDAERFVSTVEEWIKSRS